MNKPFITYKEENEQLRDKVRELEEENARLKSVKENTERDLHAMRDKLIRNIDAGENIKAQLTARVRELEEENARLHEQVDLQIPAIAFKQLTEQLAAAQEANEHWQRATAENENKWIEANDKLAKAEQRAAEWQPISTAPKDGTAILGCGGLYNDPKNGWFNTVCWWNGYGFVDDGGDVDYATHWMPLPKAPSGASS